MTSPSEDPEKLRLFELANEYHRTIRQAIDPVTGELASEELEEVLHAIEHELERKLIGCALALREIRAEEQALRDLAKSYADAAEVRKRRGDRLADYMQANHPHDLEVEGPIPIKWQRSGNRAVLVDTRYLPREYMREVEPQPDKKRLGELLKQGHEIPGAELAPAGWSYRVGGKKP